jgi:hypothetical protein
MSAQASSSPVSCAKGLPVFDAAGRLGDGEHRRVGLDSDCALGDPGPGTGGEPGPAAEVDDERGPLGPRVAGEHLEQDLGRARSETVVPIGEARARVA